MDEGSLGSGLEGCEEDPIEATRYATMAFQEDYFGLTLNNAND